MEVKINREIRNYTESIFFGLSLRQFVFSILACGVAVLLYFLLKNNFAEKFIYAYIKSDFLIPKKLSFKPVNFYYELLKDKLEKEDLNNEDIKNTI